MRVKARAPEIRGDDFLPVTEIWNAISVAGMTAWQFHEKFGTSKTFILPKLVHKGVLRVTPVRGREGKKARHRYHRHHSTVRVTLFTGGGARMVDVDLNDRVACAQIAENLRRRAEVAAMLLAEVAVEMIITATATLERGM